MTDARISASLSNRRLYTYIAIACFGLLLLDLGTDALLVLRRGRGLRELWGGIPLAVLGYLTYLALSPLALLVSAKVRVSGPRALAAHTIAAAAFVLLHAAILVSVLLPLDLLGGGFFRSMQMIVERLATFGVVSYAALAVVQRAVQYQDELRQRQVHEAVLEGALARSELATLRMQLQPHFLFNTLNSISALMYDDVPTARRMINRLSELLRAALADGSQLVPLSDELELAGRYLEIQRLRFGERLNVGFEIAPTTLAIPVPRFVLQPLLENAIKFGVARKQARSTIRVIANNADRHLSIRVEDDGVGPGTMAPASTGIGLSNTRLRLNYLYGANAAVDLAERPGGGALATLHIPLETVAVE
ncbi:MAG TPA: sensor histidine kinase [Gemmatimonas sp.]|nr:sensor histidine kinase [Gemmatimonas sp.]